MRPWAIRRPLLAAQVTLFAVLSICSAASAQERAATHVLTIHSGSEFFPPNPILDAALREVLVQAGATPIEYYAEYLESDRIGENASAALADYIGHKYQDRHIDLVIAVTNDSLRFTLQHRRVLFPDAPIVFGGIAIPDEGVRRAGPGVAALRVGSAYVQTLRLALELHPSTERVFVLARSPNQDDMRSVRAQLAQFAEQVQLTFVDEETLSQALDVIRTAPARSLILHLWQRANDRRDSTDPLEVARMVAAAAPVPVYGTVDLNIGTGIVGGVVRGTRETGLRLGQMAVKVLQGTRAQDIPVEDAPLVPIFDWRQMKRWGIAQSQLPAGAVVRYWTPTVWETYRPYIIGTVIVVAAQLLAIAGLLVQRARRRHAEEMVLAREATIRANYERIRQLAGRLINAQEAARAGIARDLHDGVCQELAGVSIAVGSLKISSANIQDAQTQNALSKIQSETLGMFEGIRRLSHELHPATLRLVGLATALQAHCSEVEKRNGVQAAFKADGAFTDLDPDVAVCLFRIAQEALRNSILHGQAKRLAVSLVRSADRVELTVTDDGCGFDLETARQKGNGLGLVSIEERAHVLGGVVDIVTRPGKGTTVHVQAPAAVGLSAI
jgi:signal transduction histidine kinase